MARILWADDEIDLLKPHVMFLENKGHELTTVQSGNEAIDAVKEEDFEIIAKRGTTSKIREFDDIY